MNAPPNDRAPTPQELIDHAYRMERIDDRAKRRGFHVPTSLEQEYRELRQMLLNQGYRTPAILAAKSLGINVDRKV